MNGILTATYRARLTRSSTSISLLHGTAVEWNEGDEVDISEDHYGNTYVVIDGVDQPNFANERISDITWHADGLRARVAECDRILAIHEPDGNQDVIAQQARRRSTTIDLLSEVTA